MAILTKAIQEALLKAHEDKKSQFVCFATGQTYAVKEDLKSYAFQWADDGSKCWTLEYVSALEKFMFERKVADGVWPGVILEFKPMVEDPLWKEVAKEL